MDCFCRCSNVFVQRQTAVTDYFSSKRFTGVCLLLYNSDYCARLKYTTCRPTSNIALRGNRTCNMLPRKAKRQHPLTLQVSRYCLLALRRSGVDFTHRSVESIILISIRNVQSLKQIKSTGLTIEAILYPANTRRWHNVELTLAHCLRLWPNISPTSGQRLVFAGPNDLDFDLSDQFTHMILYWSTSSIIIIIIGLILFLSLYIHAVTSFRLRWTFNQWIKINIILLNLP